MEKQYLVKLFVDGNMDTMIPLRKVNRITYDKVTRKVTIYGDYYGECDYIEIDEVTILRFGNIPEYLKMEDDDYGHIPGEQKPPKNNPVIDHTPKDHKSLLETDK